MKGHTCDLNKNLLDFAPSLPVRMMNVSLQQRGCVSQVTTWAWSFHLKLGSVNSILCLYNVYASLFRVINVKNSTYKVVFPWLKCTNSSWMLFLLDLQPSCGGSACQNKMVKSSRGYHRLMRLHYYKCLNGLFNWLNKISSHAFVADENSHLISSVFRIVPQ